MAREPRHQSASGLLWYQEEPMKSLGTAPGFHHVAIRAVDFDATIRFYTEGLGCRVHFPFSVPGRIDRAAFLDAGDGRFIEVFGQGSTVQAEGRRRQPNEERTEGAILHFCLRVADTEASYARALAAGAASRLEPVTRRLSDDPLVEVRIAFVTGPNGEVIELMQSEQM
jgi:catechol 2,3-dioxygenase-like lactoylglutathione lyase family enzyme